MNVKFKRRGTELRAQKQKKEKIYIYNVVISTWGILEPTISDSDIIVYKKNENTGNALVQTKFANESYLSTVETNGNEGTITIYY